MGEEEFPKLTHAPSVEESTNSDVVNILNLMERIESKRQRIRTMKQAGTLHRQPGNNSKPHPSPIITKRSPTPAAESQIEVWDPYGLY